MPSLIPGYDHRLGAKGVPVGRVSQTRAQWQVCLTEVFIAGGARQVLNGKTFVRNLEGRLVLEVDAIFLA